MESSQKAFSTPHRYVVTNMKVEEDRWHFWGPFKVNSRLDVRIYGLSADVDLYAQKGARPDVNNYSCRPFGSGTTQEQCDLIGEGTWWIGVRGWDPGTSTYQLQIHDYDLSGGILGSYYSLENQHLDQGDWHYLPPVIPYSTSGTLKILVSSTSTGGDPDLYVGSTPKLPPNPPEWYFDYGPYYPTKDRHACRPYLGGELTEVCPVSQQTGLVGIYGYSTVDYLVRVFDN